MNFKAILFSLTLVSFTFVASAQKYAYVFVQDIILSYPAAKQANMQLEAFAKQQENQLKAKSNLAQAEYNRLLEKAQKGEMSRVEQEEAEKKLIKMEEEFISLEKSSYEKIEKKRQELMMPIEQKINDAIKSVAKENGYTQIWDSAMLLYAVDGKNVTDKVKAKLGF